jgi:hypothetical protein
MHRPMTTAELYAYAQAMCPTRCENGIHDNWEIAWRHHLRNAQQHLRRIGAIKKEPKGFWSLAR